MSPATLDREIQAYGRGLLIDDGDLVLRNGRLAEVAGLANLRQGLQLRLATPWGSDRLNVTYGLDVTDTFTAALPRQMVKSVLRLSIIRSLASDPRVASIERVLFDDDPEYIASHPGLGGPPSQQRSALAEITIEPVPATGAPAAGLETTGTQALLTVLADVRW